jgi:hypothetical protein
VSDYDFIVLFVCSTEQHHVITKSAVHDNLRVCMLCRKFSVVHNDVVLRIYGVLRRMEIQKDSII